jgi:hypothetical protein
VIYCSLIAPLLWSPLLWSGALCSVLLCSPLRCAVLRCSGWRSDAVRSPSPAASLEMIEAHAARSIEEGECLRTHASGWPRGHSEDGWAAGCMSVSSFAIIERLISGRQTELERCTDRGPDHRPKQSTEYISLCWNPASRLKPCCEKWRSATGLQCSDQSRSFPAMHRYPSLISHLPSPRPMSHPCLSDRRAGRPGSLARKDASVASTQQGSAEGRTSDSTFTQERHRQGRKSLYNLPHGRAHRREDLCSTAKTILLERRPPARSSPGSPQSVSALHLPLAFEQGASAAGHRFGRQGCARARPLTGLSRPLPSSPPWPWLRLRVARRTRDVPPSLKRPLFCTFRLVLQNLRTILLNEVAESESKSRVPRAAAAAAAAVQVGSQHGNKRPLSGAEHGQQGKGVVT